MDILSSLRRAVRNHGTRPAVVDGETRLTWRDFDQRTARLAAGLARIGIGRGDRIAVLMLNSFRYLELYYTVPRLGAVIVPINTRLAPAEVGYILADSGSRVVFVDDALRPVLDGALPAAAGVDHVVRAADGPAPEGQIAYEDVVEHGSGELAELVSDRDDVVGIFYTGGTTGHPKGVMLTHDNLASNALHVAVHLGYGPEDNYLHSAPMFHLADGAATFAITMLGGRHTMLPAFRPADVLHTIERERVTHAVLVPTMINALIQTPAIERYDLSSWRVLGYGAAPIPLEVLRRAMAVLPCDFLQAYGMTEAAPILTILSPADHRAGATAAPGSSAERRLTSCGQSCVGVDVRVVDAEGEDVCPGEVGEIIARGPNVMKGYWNKAEETAYGLRDGWLHTGDLATIDDDGYLYVVDRAKDMIISGGENVYSVEVENALYAHPAVLEAAVIGVPDPQWGERVHAVVVLKPGQSATAEEIAESCRDRIAGYKRPRSVELVDALPKSGAGKIVKRELRERYWQGQTRQVS